MIFFSIFLILPKSYDFLFDFALLLPLEKTYLLIIYIFIYLGRKLEERDKREKEDRKILTIKREEEWSSKENTPRIKISLIPQQEFSLLQYNFITKR